MFASVSNMVCARRPDTLTVSFRDLVGEKLLPKNRRPEHKMLVWKLPLEITKASEKGMPPLREGITTTLFRDGSGQVI